MKQTSIVALLLLVLASCKLEGCDTPTSASMPSNNPVATLWDQWGSCIGIQVPGGTPEQAQISAMEQLADANRINWVRLGGGLGGHGRAYYETASAKRLNIMAIVHGGDLPLSSDWTAVFDQYVMLYPETTLWNIAGEVSNADPNVNPQGAYTVEAFWPKFVELYHHVQKNYPGTRITNPPTFGSGTHGAEELQAFFERGMLEMDVDIAINLYSPDAFNAYQALFRNPTYAPRIARRNVWITETGGLTPERQIQWVQTMYPKMGSAFGATALCWYILWGGNSDTQPNDNGAGLIEHIDKQTGMYTTRPLFNRLVGEGQ